MCLYEKNELVLPIIDRFRAFLNPPSAPALGFILKWKKSDPHFGPDLGPELRRLGPPGSGGQTLPRLAGDELEYRGQPGDGQCHHQGVL